ncbi:MAG: GNAT family N-acetyltransferase [Rhodoblastus sp.]|jgi:CelD/BcsL family acetyltransferase involved in cellulose biosynthesis
MARFSSTRAIQARRCSASNICVAFDPGEIAEEWRSLEETGHATVFQTRRWLEPLARIAAPAEGAEPFFVLVREKTTGAPQMLLPLCLHRRGGIRAIEFLDLGASDYNAPLIASGFRPRPSEFAALWSSISAALPPADILRIDKSPGAIAGAPNPLVHLRFMRRLALGAWGVVLPQTREAYESETLSARFRKELRRKRRRLEECGAARLVCARDADESIGMLRELAEMRRARYAALGRHDILDLAAFRAFYEDLLARENGFAEIRALEVDGLRVAIQFGLRRAEAFHFLLSGFRGDEWARKSVGGVAADMMIAQAIEDGLSAFDFTIGNAPYKRHFGAARQDLFGGAQALSYRALPEVAERRLKGSLRTFLLPPAQPRAVTSRDHWR